MDGNSAAEDAMLSHIPVGVRDFERARAFYAAILAELGGASGSSMRNALGGLAARGCGQAADPRRQTS